jgi:hypothetical protein
VGVLAAAATTAGAAVLRAATAGLTALSCVAAAAFADTTASKIALVGLHILAATIIVPVLARRA